MTIRVGYVEASEIGTSYNEFVHCCSGAMIYHTPSYLKALERILGARAPIILAARRQGIIVGAMPLFLLQTYYGSVVNSLPYYGSHGDILVAEKEKQPGVVSALMADALADFCAREKVGALNVVGHPLQSRMEAVAERVGVEIWDRRIGQMSLLQPTTDAEAALGAILSACHQKTRNLVRKSLRGNFEILISDADDDWANMIKHHQIGLERIGGRPKKPAEFAALREALRPYGMCRLYVARHKGEFAGALLNLYYRNWVEYFTPVAVSEFRSEQVLSAIIATAMRDASLEGARIWNWGGTRPNQKGVYHFKKGWGAIDHPYNYYGRVFDQGLAAASSEVLLSMFPFFYVRAFA